MSPPDIEGRCWDDLTAWQRSLLIAYNQIREHEEMEFACIGFAKKGIL